MPDFSQRQQKIISIITNHEDYVTCNEIINEIGCSRRTVINEINEINKQLPLIISSNRGYLINKEVISKLRVESVANIKDEHGLLRRLIMKNRSYSFGELADKLYISESALDKSLKDIESFISSFNIRIRREKGFIYIDGTEYDKRRLINYLINEEIDENFRSPEDIDELVEDIDLERTRHIIETSIERYDCYLDPNYSWNIFLNITIALIRMKDSSYMEENISDSINHNSNEYRIAAEICKQYSNHHHIEPKEDDILYVAALLAGQLKQSNSADNFEPLKIISDEFMEQIDRILMETFSYYMIDADYHGFLYNFALHIDAMLKRIRNKQSIINDLLTNIKRNSPFVYEIAVHITHALQQEYDVLIPDEEIGFIAVHIGFVINNSVDSFEKVRILLLCNDYHNLIKTISDKIMENHNEYVEIIPYDISINPIRTDFDVDLIITTKMINIIGKRMIVITPFYSLMDKMQVDNAIHEILTEKEMGYSIKLLTSFFHEDLFFKTDDYSNKDEVIDFLGQKVVDFGLAEADFIRSVHEREKLSSTCFFDTFAIPHSIDVFSKRSMFCVLISEKGIMWDDKKIHIVLMLAVQLNDRKEFVNIYNSIIKMLWDKEKAKQLIKADSLSEFIQMIR